MSLTRHLLLATIFSLSACTHVSATTNNICPSQQNLHPQFVDVFDGPVEEMAILIPDEALPESGYWMLGYVYDAGRAVTIRCKYADGKMLDIKLEDRVEKCNYTLDKNHQITVSCQ